MVEIKNDAQLIEYFYSALNDASKMERFNLDDFMKYLNIKIPIDKRTEQLLELYYFNKTNPFNYKEIPFILYETIVIINSLRN